MTITINLGTAGEPSRAIRYPVGDTRQTILPDAATRAGKYLAFDGDGDVVTSTGTGADAGLRTDLAENTGAALVGFGSGTVADALGFRLSRYADLQTALTASAGGTLLIDRDETLTGDIVMPDDTAMQDAGGILNWTSVATNGIVAGNGCKIIGLRLVGPNIRNGAQDFGTSGNAIFANGKSFLLVEGCTITGWNHCGVQLRNCTDYTIRRNLFFGNLWGNGNSSDICTYGGNVRGKINDNRLYSNNSQGLFYNPLGSDSDAIITGNIAATMDATGTALMPETVSNLRRHGFSIGYNGSTVGRFICANNIAMNTRWTGFYLQSASGARNPALIANNIAYRCGILANDATPDPVTGLVIGPAGGLTGGIWLRCTGGEVVTGNLIIETQSTGGGGGMYLASAATDGDVTVTDNYIGDSADVGMNIAIRLERAFISGNRFVGNAGADMLISLTPGPTTIGGFYIESNHFRRLVEGYCIDHAPADGVLPCIIRQNRFVGPGASANALNTAIRTRALTFAVTDNGFVGFNRALDHITTLAGGTRFEGIYRFDRNRVRDCNVAIGIGASANTSTFPLEANTLENTPTLADGGSIDGFVIGRAVKRENGAWVLVGTAAPTTGQFAQGDRIWFSNVAAAGAPGAVCVTGGAPGTWKDMAAVAA